MHELELGLATSEDIKLLQNERARLDMLFTQSTKKYWHEIELENPEFLPYLGILGEKLRKLLLGDKSVSLYVARVNGKIAGYCFFEGAILNLFGVRKEFARSKISRKLLEYAIRDYFARNKRLKLIRLYAVPRKTSKLSSKALESFYEKMGGIKSKHYESNPLSSKYSPLFIFPRPRENETFIQARERFINEYKRKKIQKMIPILKKEIINRKFRTTRL